MLAGVAEILLKTERVQAREHHDRKADGSTQRFKLCLAQLSQPHVLPLPSWHYAPRHLFTIVCPHMHYCAMYAVWASMCARGCCSAHFS